MKNELQAGTKDEQHTDADSIPSASVAANQVLSAALSENRTVLQELIEYFEQQLALQRESNIKYTGEEAFFDALDICKNAYSTKEKQQIKDAFNQGYREGFTDGNNWSENEKDVAEFEDADNYYKNKFVESVSVR